MTKESAELEQLIQEPLAPLQATRTLERIMTDARRVSGCDAVGIFRRLSPDAVRIAASEPAVRRADELQLELQEGPCVDAATGWEVRASWTPASTRGGVRWLNMPPRFGIGPPTPLAFGRRWTAAIGSVRHRAS